jgi:hypothetical protein
LRLDRTPAVAHEPRTESPSGFVIVAALCVATSVTFSQLLSARALPTFRDLLFFTWPLKHFLHERVLAGELPLWNPLLLMGTPFLANWQSGLLYPPSLLLLLPLPLGFNVFLLAHYFIALLGAWVWLRGRALDPWACGIGAAVFALGGFLVSLLNLTNHLQAAVWAPWVFFFWDRFAAHSRSSDLLCFVGMLAVELLAASPENFLLTLCVVTAGIVHRNYRDWRTLARLSCWLICAALVTGALCAVQMIPTYEYFQQSSRAVALSFGAITYYSLERIGLLQLLLPHSTALLPPETGYFLGPSFETKTTLIQSYYLGAVALCLAIVGGCLGRERLFWSSLLLGGVVLALGDHTPVFPALYHAMPRIVGKFRYPEKFFLLAHVAASVLAAEGARRILERGAAAGRIALAVTTALLAMAIGLCLLRWYWQAPYLQLVAMLTGRHMTSSALAALALDTYWKAQRLTLLLAALAAIVLAFRADRLPRTTAAWLLLALVVGDLASANRNLNPSMPWPELEARPPLIDATAARDRGERIFHGHAEEVPGAEAAHPQLRLAWWVPMIEAHRDLDDTYRSLWETMNSDAGMLHGVANVSGSDGITRASDSLLLDVMGELPIERAVKLLRIFGAGYVLGPDWLPTPAVSNVGLARDTPYYALRVRDPLPLVYAVSRLRDVASPKAALLAICEDDFDPRREAVVEGLPSGWPRGSEDASTTRITMLERRDDLWRLHAEASHDAFVVVNESFFPGWVAALDGVPTPIFRTNGIVRGIVVPTGSHVVELAYRPRSFRIGAAISLTSLCVIALVRSFALRSRRKPTAISADGAHIVPRTADHIG